MPIINITAYSLAFLLIIFSHNLRAEASEYQIELIAFAQTMPDTEVFDQTESQIKWPAALTELAELKHSERGVLDGGYAAISKVPAYRPVLHIAWIQSIGENNPGAPVHIKSEDGQLNGYLQIQRGKTLQLLVDLEYTPGQRDSSVNSFYSEPVIYRLNQKQPIQLNEIYYLDHPKFGVIATIKRL
ncbi:Peptidoglycan-binding protein CsiV [Candidatus Methylobacter favarea]|uniref:Peptidoglycan-binding protein CsiV n=1 Tax=Candidatus Methylobacter favarea TaxID=2707345 RepID=A0A8S0WZ42_9GAMM|nr:CsiV family protein [Candidatus Methylobacter favarea]CAA9889955.1 Peptidoglycan-binding protein CsiV [Candidatus Methylobacter favarea]